MTGGGASEGRGRAAATGTRPTLSSPSRGSARGADSVAAVRGAGAAVGAAEATAYLPTAGSGLRSAPRAGAAGAPTDRVTGWGRPPCHPARRTLGAPTTRASGPSTGGGADDGGAGVSRASAARAAASAGLGPTSLAAPRPCRGGRRAHASPSRTAAPTWCRRTTASAEPAPVTCRRSGGSSCPTGAPGAGVRGFQAPLGASLRFASLTRRRSPGPQAGGGGTARLRRASTTAAAPGREAGPSSSSCSFSTPFRRTSRGRDLSETSATAGVGAGASRSRSWSAAVSSGRCQAAARFDCRSRTPPHPLCPYHPLAAQLFSHPTCDGAEVRKKIKFTLD